MLRQDYDRAYSARLCPPVQAGRSDLAYIGALARGADTELLRRMRPQVAVYAADELLLSLAERAMEKAGCAVRAEWEEEMMELAPGEIGLWLSDDGETVRMADEEGCLSESAEELMRVWAALELGMKTVVVPVSATHAAETLAQRYDADIVRVRGERASLMRELIECDRRQMMLRFDGIYAALICVGLLKKYSLTPSEWTRDMPSLERCVRSVSVGWQERGRILHELLEQEDTPDLTDGLCVSRDGGWALVSPMADRPECRVIGEAADSETAEELCAFYEDRIRQLLRQGEESGR